ncbi:flagellar biosynthetic protein FliO [Bacillus horti]|uniref:Flagellar protein FliO/FliZ n=1 Tax=Caldalkalibacillus horti TaxID=77523 RepID=A0ABT9VUW8_9BACI|nr:flagellar biosynthetic protein FliO [Bacillus horti]MDQ0164675.1 flagellar protein FliO/FliZ [Bacillus horti]
MTSIFLRHRRVWQVIVIICLCSLPHISFAQTVEEMYNNEQNLEGEQESTDGVNDSSSSDPESSNALVEGQSDHPIKLIATFIFYLIIVIILIYALVRFLSIRQRKMQSNGVFQNLGGLVLGQNKSLQLVQIGQELYVIGVADQIQLIKEIKDGPEKELILQQIAEQDNALNTRFMTSLPWRKKENQTDTPSYSFQDLFKQSINQQKDSQLVAERKLDSMNTEQREGRIK